MQIVIAAKKLEGAYEAALLVDQKFNRSKTSKSLNDVVMKLLAPIFSIEREDGTEVAVSVAILTAAEVLRAEERERQQRELAETTAEAERLEQLKAAKEREQKARATDAKQS
jgi:hypothetical protein